LIVTWMSLRLWQADRHSRAVVREVRQSILQELTRQSQFARLLDIEKAHLSRQDLNAAARREELVHLVRMLDQLSQTVERPAAR
jgi:hypothetical protein